MVQGIERGSEAAWAPGLGREWQEGVFFTQQRRTSHTRVTAAQLLKFQASELPGEMVNNGHSQALPQHSDLKGGGGAWGTEL